MMVLVDSDVLLEVSRARDASIVSRWMALSTSDTPILFSPVTEAELWAGARPSEHEFLEELFGAMTCAPVNAGVGRRAGDYLRRYRKSHGVELGDALIAATAPDSEPATPFGVAAYEPPDIRALHLERVGISTVLWATGYRQDLGWIEPLEVDEMGFARQTRGTTDVPGLSLIGSLWQHDQLSATLVGLPRDARFLAARLELSAAD